MADRISAFDSGYKAGDLSVFPIIMDDRETLYKVTNNTKVPLKQTLTASAKVVIVESTAGFPDNGQIRIGPRVGPGINAGEYELIAYGSKTPTTFQDLQRGFGGSKRSQWAARDNYVTNCVAADHHNTLKDALINIEHDLGVRVDPTRESLNGILKWQETRHLAPKPLFRATRLKSPAPATIRFQNFSTGHIVRYFWDFGDGTTSVEKSPVHTYRAEGKYTVKLNIITSTGGQGQVTKLNYINVDNNETPAFFYVDSITDPYSVASAALRTNGELPPDYQEILTMPKEFVFVDQTDGDIVERHWVFGDGQTYTESDPDRHWVSHVYDQPSGPDGYYVTLLIVLSTGQLKRAQLADHLIVL